MKKQQPLDQISMQLAAARGRDYWHLLDNLVDTDDFRRSLSDKFPAVAGLGDLKRRDLLKCLGGALALAGLDGCERMPDEHALPYVETPEGETVGIARHYASMIEMDGVAQPIIGKTFDGRPVKIDGHPDHPASGGASTLYIQAALLDLYDPERSSEPLRHGRPSSWTSADDMLAALRQALDKSGGQGFRLLTGPVGSPTLRRQINDLLTRWPRARWHQHRPIADLQNERLQLAKADCVVALDHDFLGSGPFQLYHARGWSERRRAFQRGDGSAQLFVAEPSPSVTGVTAGDRLPIRQDRIYSLLLSLAEALGLGTEAPPTNSRERDWVNQAASALLHSRGQGLVTVGPHHPPETQALARHIDVALNNEVVTRLWLAEPGGPTPETYGALLDDMKAGSVETLFVMGCNPAYADPNARTFAREVQKVANRVHAGAYNDETAMVSHWHLPMAHLLESWSDGVAADGSALLCQPLVRPWLATRSRHDLLHALMGISQTGRDLVRETWPQLGEDRQWNEALYRGALCGQSIAYQPPPQLPPLPGPQVEANDGLSLIVRPDPTVWDGQYASNPWLQECPKPMTKIVWGNAVHISPAMAANLELENGDLVQVSSGAVSAKGPAFILPGQDRRTILVHLGGGRRHGGKVASGCGQDFWQFLAANGPVSIQKLQGTGEICTTQHHFTMEGEEFVKFVGTLAEKLPAKPAAPNFFPPQKSSPAWGMAIDLDLCIGCNACVVACVAENNIPMVGRDEVAKGREMHWLRIDRYVQGEGDTAIHAFQPVPCMHCEDAPCEMGCPVNATVHSPDGLNLQVYNRCIGTRTCSAYCPYKVRRFNWFDLTRDDPPEVQAARNPEVTVRGRGVMEKCTYCIQRISAARIDAKKENRSVRDGEVVTACQAACPTDAIVFGDISRPESAVSRTKANRRDYDLLAEANTRPRTTYGARIRSGKGQA